MARSGIFGPQHRMDFERRYFEDYTQLDDVIKFIRVHNPDCVIGFTGGVWDLLHLAHASYIEAARDLCDFLVVGCDTDELARERKKTTEVNRPIVGFKERARMLSQNRAVDLITPVRTDVEDVIKVIRPDILVVSETTRDLPPGKYDKYFPHLARGQEGMVVLEAKADPAEISTTARIRRLSMENYEAARTRMHAGVEQVFDDLVKSHG